MSRLTDEHRIGYFGDWTESDCRGPSILNTAFLADAQELLKVTLTRHSILFEHHFRAEFVPVAADSQWNLSTGGRRE